MSTNGRVGGLYPLRSMYVPLLIFVSIATMTGGNLAAITQNNLKRLLAYSSIAHVGYMLLGLIASESSGASAPRRRVYHQRLPRVLGRFQEPTRQQ